MEQEKERTLRAMEALDLDSLSEGVQNLIAMGCDTLEIEEILQHGMQLVGNRFEEGEYYLADLIVSGMMFKSSLKYILKDTPRQGNTKTRGRILIGVVAGDIHDIGKDIVTQILQSESFDVLDLGVDVTAGAFVQAAKSYSPDVIALSGVMGDSVNEMRSVIGALAEAGIHPKTPVVVGGSCVSSIIIDKIGADFYACGPVDTMKICKRLMESKKIDE